MAGHSRRPPGKGGARRAKGATRAPARQDGAARTRLDIDMRRQQLVEIGMELFANRPYDDVWVEEIAAAAGVSRGLLYHYFPTKRDFFVAVMRAQLEHLAELTAPDMSKPPLESLRETLDVYIDDVVSKPQAYISLHRAGISSEPEVRALLAEAYARDVGRIVERLTMGGDAGPLLPVAIRGWLIFTISTVTDWIESPTISREQLCELLLQTMKACVFAVLEVDPSLKLPGIAEAEAAQ
jgi:AcrR family transcriptional regulator